MSESTTHEALQAVLRAIFITRSPDDAYERTQDLILHARQDVLMRASLSPTSPAARAARRPAR